MDMVYWIVENIVILLMKKKKKLVLENFMNLNNGDIIKINGWIFVRGLNDGDEYEVIKSEKNSNSREIYWFKKLLKSNKLSKKIVGFYIEQIDPWIRFDDRDNNCIKILSRFNS